MTQRSIWLRTAPRQWRRLLPLLPGKHGRFLPLLQVLPGEAASARITLSEEFAVHIEPLCREVQEYKVHSHMLVEELRAEIHHRYEVCLEDFDVIYAGTCLREGFVLSDYNVHQNSRLHVVISSRKGMGSLTAWKNRIERVLKPLWRPDMPLNLYSYALKRLADNNTVLYAALQETIAPMLLAKWRKTTCGSRRQI